MIMPGNELVPTAAATLLLGMAACAVMTLFGL